jgi:hypothetical protein
MTRLAMIQIKTARRLCRVPLPAAEPARPIDLAQCGAARGLAYCKNSQRGGLARMRAVDVMTSEVAIIGEDASVQAAVRLTAERGISALPVVAARGASSCPGLRRVEDHMRPVGGSRPR